MNISIPTLSGRREDVIAALQSRPNLDPALRDLLIARVNALPSNGAAVSAFEMDQRGAANLHVTVSPLNLVLTTPPEQT